MKILLDCERMKFRHTGLYYFCLKLGHALQEQVNKEELYFYTPASAKNCFGKALYVQQHSMDKFALPRVKKLDVWHCTFQGSSYFPFRKKVHKVLTIHDINFMNEGGLAEEKKSKYLSLLARKIQLSDHITAISQYTLNEVKRVIDIGNKPASVVYNGCNIEPSGKAVKPAHPPSRPFLFTIGTILEKKNMHVLPALLHNNHFELIISGITLDENYRQKIMEEALRWKVQDRVTITGAVTEDEKRWYLQHCEAFVFPSLAEGFGLPVVEAMYFGKPVLLSTRSSLPEIGGNLAYYFDNFEPGHMQQVLIDSLQHYNKVRPYNAIKQRAAQFSWKAAATQYLDIYHSLLAGNR
jgi:glycosyltransferase involved in cell wall biosynthesis